MCGGSESIRGYGRVYVCLGERVGEKGRRVGRESKVKWLLDVS